MKTRYMLRIRPDDSSEWGPPTEYPSRKDRDRDASINRIIGGMRTHAYQERCDVARTAANPSELDNQVNTESKP